MMSLLNDMLRDLTHQQKVTEAPASTQQAELDFNAQEQRELFYHTRAIKPLPRTLVPSLVIFILALAIFSLWKIEFFTSPDSGITSVEPVVIEPTPLVHAVAVTQPAVAPAAAPAGTPSVDHNAPASELGTRIAALESAINNLSAAVADANNHSGDEPAIADPDFGQQTEYESAFAESGAQSDDEFLQTEQISEQAIDAAPASVSIQEPFAQSMDDQSLTEQSFAEQSLAVQGEPQFSISPNIKWQDQQRAQEANQLVAQGQIDSAIEKLQNYIATAAQPRESVKTLLDIFAVQENISAIQTLLAQANYLSVDEQSFYNAKIAVIQQKDAQAIQLLEANLGKAEHNENYRALLAGLYQRTGLHLEAANHYRRLLSVFGEKPAYWLGFALSQDALNQSKVAAQAYQRVNQYADLQPQVRTYVQQRIAALQE
jgi:MSHA biogenesis protein MshN